MNLEALQKKDSDDVEVLARPTLQSLIQQKKELLREWNSLYRELKAIDYEGDLYAMDHTFEERSEEKSIQFDAVDRRLLEIDELLMQEFVQHPGAVLLANEECQYELRLKASLQQLDHPNIGEIKYKVSENIASEDDMRRLNTIDLGKLDREKALEAVAAIKVKYIKNQIYSGCYEGKVKYSHEGTNLSITTAQKKMLDLIESVKVGDKNGWQWCLQKIAEIAKEGAKEENSKKRGIFLLNSDVSSFYDLILRELSSPPPDVTDDLQKRTQREVAKELARGRMTVDEILGEMASLLKGRSDAKELANGGKPLRELADHLYPYQKSETARYRSAGEDASYIINHFSIFEKYARQLGVEPAFCIRLNDYKKQLISALNKQANVSENINNTNSKSVR
jgi:hypothetical protein